MIGTSERTPVLYRMLRASYDVFGLATPYDQFLYDTGRAKWPRLLLYAVDKLILGLRGLFLAREHRVNLVFSGEMAHYALPGLAIARILGIRCVWDSHGNVKLFSESVRKGWFSSHLAIFMERFLGKSVDILITVSERDAEAYAQMGVPRSNIHVIPTCVNLSEISATRLHEDDFSYTEKHTPHIPVLLFFGSFGYAPNREALDFVNLRVAPYLERAGIHCEIHIAGRDIPDLVFHPFVKALGFVPDIHACIQSVDLCIVPVSKGVGILTKVLDIMAVGTPAVLHSFALHGIPDIQHGIHAYVASSEEEFLKYVSEALASPEVGRNMARRARQLVEQRYDWELQKPRLDAILQGGLSDTWQDG